MAIQNIEAIRSVSKENSDQRPKIKVLIPASLLLSFFIGLKFPQKEEMSELLALVFLEEIIGLITSLDFISIESTARLLIGDKADELLDLLKKNFKVCEVDKDSIESVVKSEFFCNSFDTAIANSLEERIDVFITETEFIREIEIIESGESDAEDRIRKILVLRPKEFVSRYVLNERKIENLGSIQVNLADIPDVDTLQPLPPEDLRGVIDGWVVERFEVRIVSSESSKGEITLWNKSESKLIRRSAYGNGAVDALVKALRSAVFEAVPTLHLPFPTFSRIFLTSSDLGCDSPVSAVVTVDLNELNEDEEDKSYSVKGSFTHTDTVKAVFYAYLEAIRQAKITDNKNCRDNKHESITQDFLTSEINSKRKDFSSLVLTDLSLNDLDLSGIKLRGSSILQSNLRRSIFSSQGHNNNGDFRDVIIDLSNLDKANFSYADFNHAQIVATTMNESIFLNADLSDAVIRGSELYGADFTKAKLARVNFISCHLDGAILEKACLNRAVLSGVDLPKANLKGAYLSLAVFNDANLKEAELTNANLQRTNFSRANLTNVDFTGATIDETTFAFADLSGANLQHLNLTTACFKGATLDNANLSNTNLGGLDFTETSLKGVNLTGAKLSGLKLTDEQKKKLTDEQQEKLVSNPNSVIVDQKTKNSDYLCNGRH
jgi:uncharacterized protein YjbI with pentapeptide repeats